MKTVRLFTTICYINRLSAAQNDPPNPQHTERNRTPRNDVAKIGLPYRNGKHVIHRNHHIIVMQVTESS
jgi:hypothetical protein